MLIERTDVDQRGSLIEGTASEPRSVISVPLSFSGKLIGVMTLSKKLGIPFNQKQYDLIALFSLKAALAVQNAYMMKRSGAMRPVYRCTTVPSTHDVANFNCPHGWVPGDASQGPQL